jgi:hypothetical protein
MLFLRRSGVPKFEIEGLTSLRNRTNREQSPLSWYDAMLDKVKKPAKKKTAFDVWWSALPLNIRESNDVAFVWRCFRSGHVGGAKPSKTKYRFRAGRLVVSVWATNRKEAAREAANELDYRVARAGKRPPAAGWKLTPVADDA